jgi:plastocyanin
MSDRPKRALHVQVGDTVAFRKTFLNGHSAYLTGMKSARGKVTALKHLEAGIVLADIDWNKSGLPTRVNERVLARLKGVRATERQ